MTCVILTVMATESKRGGKREGAGRKPSANPATKLMTIKMTPEQHAQFLALGGARWLKKVLAETKVAP